MAFEPNAAALQVAYDTVGGSATSLVPQSTLGAASAFIGSVTADMDQWRRGSQVAPAPAQNGDGQSIDARSAWGSPMGAATTGGGISGQVYGGTAGWDGELANAPAMVGLALNLSQTQLAANTYGATVETNYGGIALYGMERFGPAYVSVSGSLGYSHATQDRNFQNLGLALSTSAGFDSVVLAGRIEAGYSLDLPGTGAKLTPFAAIQPMQLWQSGASEWFYGYGAGLTYSPATITALPAFLGVQLDGTWSLPGGGAVTPFLKLAWMHDFSPGRAVSRNFAELPGFSFSGNALPTVADAADIHAGLQLFTGGNVTLSASFDGQIGSGYSVLGGSGILRVKW